jgi:soluble lytic murein transglycosylase-like protein
MAKIDDTTGIQSVLPETRLPDDYRHVQANPEQFGGLIARGIEQEAAGKRQLGQGEAELGRGESQLGQTFGKVAANDAFNQVNEQAQHLLHGDPNKKDPVTGAADGGYLSLQGRAALMARQGVEQKLDELVSNARAGMTTLDQQLEFDTITRHARANWTAEIGAHADAGQKTWYNDVYDAGIKQGLDGVSRNPGDSPEQTEARKHNAADVVRSVADQAALAAGAKRLPDGSPDPGDPVVKAAIAKGEKLVNQAYVESLVQANPDRAREVMAMPKMQAALGDAYPALAERLKHRLDQGQAASTAATLWSTHGTKFPYANPDLPIFNKVTWENPGGFSTAGLFRTAIIESNGNPNAVSSTGAKGLMQFVGGTWKQYGKGDPSDPVASLVAGQHYSIANAQVLRANGYEPNDALLYLAHQQDGQKVVRALQNPNAPAWQIFGQTGVLKNDGTLQQTAGQFMAMWTRRFNGTDPDYHPLSAIDDTDLPTMKQGIYADLEHLPVSPEVREMARHQVDTWFEVRAVAEAQDSAAKKAKIESAADQYLVAAEKPGADRAMMVARASIDPAFNGDPQMRVWIKRALSEPPGVEGNGSGFAEARRRALLPEGDPLRITDMRPIWEMSKDGAITAKGISEMRSLFNDLHGRGENSPEFQHVMQGVLNGAKSRLSFDGEFGDIPGMPPKRDLKGEQIYNEKFTRWFFGELQTKTTAADRWKFINDEKLIQDKIDSLRPRAQMAQDRLLAGADHEPVPPAPQGVTSMAWGDVMATRPVINGRPMPMENWARAIDYLRANPTPDMIKHFDAKAYGFSGKEILDKLGGKGQLANNLAAADAQMDLTPQEKALYQRHLTNLTGPGGVDNANGSRSTLFQATVEHKGKVYSIPTVWDGKILNIDDALKRVEKEGWDKFPSYKTEEEAEARYQQMHKFMEADTAQFMQSRSPAQRLDAGETIQGEMSVR